MATAAAAGECILHARRRSQRLPRQEKMRERTRKKDRAVKNAYRRRFENGEDNYIY